MRRIMNIFLILAISFVTSSAFAWEQHKHNYKHKTPPGWHHGKKEGWHGKSMPPGHVKKHY